MSLAPKKVLLVGPVLSNSGYGEHARCILRSLIANITKFDIYIQPTMWGQTSTSTANTPENRFILDCISRTQSYKGKYDISLQVALPNEWKTLADKNIGFTAAVETDRCNPQWIQHCNQMDEVVVVSDHAGKSITNFKYPLQDQAGNAVGILSLEKPYTVIGYPVKSYTDSSFASQLDLPEQCFLSVVQAAPRKDYVTLIKTFIEEFKDEEVGLLLKMNLIKDSVPDRYNLTRHLKGVLNSIDPGKERKCKVILLHGRLEESDLHSLYLDPRIKAYVTTTHGEGYGLPIFEAAYSGLPVVAPNWSGYLDFLRAPYTNKKSGKTKWKSLFLKTKCSVNKVEPDAHMKDIIFPESQWAYVDQDHFKKNLRSVLRSNKLYRDEAEALKNYLHEAYSSGKINDQIMNIIDGLNTDSLVAPESSEPSVFMA
tara:strand:+ start:1709 stop:2986 length:1278 start_codon:yes stop_codon:yes gene_type:complete